jgi:ubiquinone biosynthesis protein
MAVQPHLLLLQKTMVMVEGLAQALDPRINMWDVSAPFVRAWIRDELGPEAAIAERLRTDVQTLARIPELVRRIEERFPARGGAPEAPPLREVPLVWAGWQSGRQGGRQPDGNHAGASWLGYLVAGVLGGLVTWMLTTQGWLG